MPELQRLRADHAAAVLAFELANRGYFAASISDRGDEFFDQFAERHSALDEDLQTGIAGGDYLVAFEIDEIDVAGRQGWSVLIQGPAHHVSGDERASAERAGVEPWPAGDRELFIRIVPNRVTGRRIKPS